MAGASRSVSLVLAYLMSITDSDYWQCLAIVTNRRKCANPNFGFRMQLIKYATDRVSLVDDGRNICFIILRI